jgi:integrase
MSRGETPMKLRLTDTAMAALAAQEGKREGLVMDEGQPGLAVRVTNAGAKTFWLFVSQSGKRHKIKLGPWPTLTLAAARKAAKAHAGKAAFGVDITAERAEVRAAAKADQLTLGALIEQWRTEGLADKKPGYVRRALPHLRAALKGSLNEPAAKFGPDKARAVIRRLASKGLKRGQPSPSAAVNFRRYGSALFGWAIKEDVLTGPNPFKGLPTPKLSARDRVLELAEMRAIYQAAEALPLEPRAFVKLALLTLARRNELAKAKRSEFDLGVGLWRVPAARMKRGLEHLVPLSTEAKAIVKSLPDISKPDAPLFCALGEIDRFMARVRDLAGLVEPWTLHDFRRGGVTLLASMGVNEIVADLLLSHAPAKLGVVGRIYQRHNYLNERREALERLAAALVSENVVALAEARRGVPAQTPPARA